MKPVRYILILLLPICSFGQKSFLGFTPLSDTIEPKKQGVFAIPLLYYTPDTRWAAGAAGVYYFRAQPKSEDDIEARSSYIQFLSDYTQNKQLDVWGIWSIFTRNEDYLLEGELRYRNFPDRFYGIGNASDKHNEEFYEYNLFSIKSLMMKKVRPSLFVGFDYEFEAEYDFKYDADSQLGSGNISGSKGGIGSAIGLVAVYDDRDNIINAYRGRYSELSSYFFTKAIGSSFSFIQINGIHQQYWQLRKKHILASQTKIKINIGNVPFLDMATLGDDDILRGYAKNRYRDHNFWATQVEYRFPLFWRLGMVTFAGVGDVFKNPQDLAFNKLKYSIGTGIRFVVKPAERLNIRLDYGYGTEGGHYYFIVTEAF